MPDGMTIERITLGDLRADQPWTRWDDPDDIAPMTPGKRAVFLDNPATQNPGTVVQFLAIRDGIVVGREDMLPGALLVRGERVLTSWGSGMFVPERYRGQGIGKALAIEREAVHDPVCSCSVSKMLQPIYVSRGWTDMSMQRMVLLRTARPVAERVFGGAALGRLAAGVGNLGVRVHGGLLAMARALGRRGVRITRVESMPEEINEHFARITAPVVCERSAAWVNWLLRGSFEPHPRDQQALFLVHDQRDELIGYALTKLRYHEQASHRGFRDVLLGSLQDWLIVEPDRHSFRTLALLTMHELARLGADAVEICLPAPMGRGGLLPLGLMPVGAQHALFKAGPGTPLADPTFRDPAAWHIRPGDGDAFFT